MRRTSIIAALGAAALATTLTGLVSTARAAAPSTTWSVGPAMSADPIGNPIADAGSPDVWSFYGGNGTDASAWELLGQGTAAGCNGGYYSHVSANDIHEPIVGYNTYDDSCSGPSATPRPAILMHPAPDRDSIVRWTSPVTGTVSVSADIQDTDGGGGNGIVYELDGPDGPLEVGAFDNGGSATFQADDVGVTPGQSLDLHIGANGGNEFYDSTGVTLTVTQTSGNPPTPVRVTRSSPRKAYQGQVKKLTVTGSGFTTASRVRFDDPSGLSVGTPTSVTPTRITVPVTIAPNAAPTLRHVVVSGSTCAKPASCAFTVYRTPTLSSVDPASVQQGSEQTVSLTGDQFAVGMTVTVSGTGVTAGSVTVDDPQHASFTVTVAPEANKGSRSITVRDLGGGHSTAKKALTITPMVVTG